MCTIVLQAYLNYGYRVLEENPIIATYIAQCIFHLSHAASAQRLHALQKPAQNSLWARTLTQPQNVVCC